MKTAAKGSRIANHAWSHDHVIDINNAQSLTKAVLASESFWNLGTPRLHLMRTITLAHSQDNIAFLSTNILNVLFPNFILLFSCFITLHCIYFSEDSFFSLFHPLKTAVQAVESLCFYIFSQRTFFNFLTNNIWFIVQHLVLNKSVEGC